MSGLGLGGSSPSVGGLGIPRSRHSSIIPQWRSTYLAFSLFRHLLFSSSHAPTQNRPRRGCPTAGRPSTSTVPMARQVRLSWPLPYPPFCVFVLPQSTYTPGRVSGWDFSVTDFLSLVLCWQDRRQVCLIHSVVTFSGTSH